jgi:two-component system, NtrC family, response regulator PilR
MAKILLLDDEQHTRRVIELHLGKHGHQVRAGKDGREGLDLLAREPFDLIITDLRMPRISGMELLKEIREQGLQIPVIVLTAFTSIESAVEAMKLGAADYIGKPPQLDEIIIKVDNLLARQSLLQENLRLKEELENRFGFEGVIGSSQAIRQLLEKVRVLARDPDISILITGESGTGKELAARTIHYNSPRKRGPFVAINCGALPEQLLESELFGHEKGAFTGAVAEKKGLFEIAHRGTLFLDEISAMPAAMQVKLLRAIEEHEIRRVGGIKDISIDIRILSASNQDLEQLVEEKIFRQDLFYRLSVAAIELPPLRERRGDLLLLANHFLEKFNREKGKNLTLGSDLMNILEAYHWPGNVRELGHLIELLVVMVSSGEIRADYLPDKFKKPRVAGEDLGDDLKIATRKMVAGFEREFILRLLEKHHWNVTKTAIAIGLSRAALHAKMKEYSIGE